MTRNRSSVSLARNQTWAGSASHSTSTARNQSRPPPSWNEARRRRPLRREPLQAAAREATRRRREATATEKAALSAAFSPVTDYSPLPSPLLSPALGFLPALGWVDVRFLRNAGRWPRSEAWRPSASSLLPAWPGWRRSASTCEIAATRDSCGVCQSTCGARALQVPGPGGLNCCLLRPLIHGCEAMGRGMPVVQGFK